jgi:hypothetical protein
MSKFMPLLGCVVVIAMIGSVVVGQPLFAVIALLSSWPFIFPLAALGCYKCDYNIFLPYRGNSFSEHGDSWTHPEVEQRMWGTPMKVPQACPKCGAQILKTSAPLHTSERAK